MFQRVILASTEQPEQFICTVQTLLDIVTTAASLGPSKAEQREKEQLWGQVERLASKLTWLYMKSP